MEPLTLETFKLRLGDTLAGHYKIKSKLGRNAPNPPKKYYFSFLDKIKGFRN